jgi:pSer/pThr/pTyr-binding forkhead associated (FHA) protein
MAWLVDVETRVRDYLAERSLVGRASQCWTRSVHPSVSKEHAVLAFEAGGWTLKDLGSRNGTWADGKRLEPGVGVCLEKESRLRFGDVGFVLETVEAPTLCARRTSNGECIVAELGILSLPDDENPAASGYEVAPGSWAIDHAGQTQRLQDGDTFYLQDERFVLRVPGPDTLRALDCTVAIGSEMVLAEAKLRLDVSQDEESISTRLEAETRTLHVPSRATHQVLLVLGRQRVTDQRAGLAESECGWLYADELAKLMRTDVQKVNVDVHRLRQQLAKLGVLDASRIVERRITSHQMRLGVAQIAIQ